MYYRPSRLNLHIIWILLGLYGSKIKEMEVDALKNDSWDVNDSSSTWVKFLKNRLIYGHFLILFFLIQGYIGKKKIRYVQRHAKHTHTNIELAAMEPKTLKCRSSFWFLVFLYILQDLHTISKSHTLDVLSVQCGIKCVTPASSRLGLVSSEDAIMVPDKVHVPWELRFIHHQT